MLIATIPQVHQEALLKLIIEHPAVDAVRFNTGATSAYDPYETVARIATAVSKVKKPVYIDLKGKQLRVVEWANLPDGPILVNHKIEVELPARVFFRGDDRCNLCKVVNGNELFVDPLPKAPVGRGQAVNIISNNLKIAGGLTDRDHEYIKAALAEGITKFLLSFVESWDDVKELEEAIAFYGKGIANKCEIGLKIESKAGVDFVKNNAKDKFGGRYKLMAARDDLMIQVGLLRVPDALRAIIKKDKSAICASRLLLGLERGAVSLADVSDMLYMRDLGYEHFMLCDGISREHAQEALDFWQECYS